MRNAELRWRYANDVNVILSLPKDLNRFIWWGCFGTLAPLAAQHDKYYPSSARYYCHPEPAEGSQQLYLYGGDVSAQLAIRLRLYADLRCDMTKKRDHARTIMSSFRARSPLGFPEISNRYFGVLATRDLIRITIIVIPTEVEESHPLLTRWRCFGTLAPLAAQHDKYYPSSARYYCHPERS